jgi:hypothetical protein
VEYIGKFVWLSLGPINIFGYSLGWKKISAKQSDVGNELFSIQHLKTKYSQSKTH